MGRFRPQFVGDASVNSRFALSRCNQFGRVNESAGTNIRGRLNSVQSHIHDHNTGIFEEPDNFTGTPNKNGSTCDGPWGYSNLKNKPGLAVDLGFGSIE